MVQVWRSFSHSQHFSLQLLLDMYMTPCFRAHFNFPGVSLTGLLLNVMLVRLQGSYQYLPLVKAFLLWNKVFISSKVIWNHFPVNNPFSLRSHQPLSYREPNSVLVSIIASGNCNLIHCTSSLPLPYCLLQPPRCEARRFMLLPTAFPCPKFPHG